MNSTKAPAVSIIVPVYKAEAYLHRCVDSLLAQTFTDFEVLLIDDGSPDKSGEICDDYAARDPRVKVIHKPNGGVSSARQSGIDHAQGEYTIHADPDDWVEPTMLAELYAKAKGDDADMVICDYYVDLPDHRVDDISQRKGALAKRGPLRSLLFQQLHGSCCNKLVRRACYSSGNPVRFPEGLNYCEDYIVCVQLLMKPGFKVSYLGRAFYHYDQVCNEESITRKFTMKTYEQLSLFAETLKGYVGASPAYYFNLGNVASDAIQNRLFGDEEFEERYKKSRWPLLLYVRPFKKKLIVALAAFGHQHAAISFAQWSFRRSVRRLFKAQNKVAD